MTRVLAAITAALFVAALAGCGGGEPEPSPTAVGNGPLGSPATDDRRGCQAVAAITGAAETDTSANRSAGALAAKASTPGIAKAGVQLVSVANQAAVAPDVVPELARARRNLIDACTAALGAGPW